MQAKLRSHLEKTGVLTDEEFALISRHFELKDFQKHQTLFESGMLVNHAYFVISGLLKLVYTDADAQEYIVSFAIEDWWESDFYAYFTQSRASMTLSCLEASTLYCLSLKNYHELSTKVPNMARFFLQQANMGFVGAQQRIISLLTTSARERYEQLRLQSPSLLQRVSKTQLASYLGVSRETLSRLHR